MPTTLQIAISTVLALESALLFKLVYNLKNNRLIKSWRWRHTLLALIICNITLNALGISSLAVNQSWISEALQYIMMVYSFEVGLVGCCIFGEFESGYPVLKRKYGSLLAGLLLLIFCGFYTWTSIIYFIGHTGNTVVNLA